MPLLQICRGRCTQKGAYLSKVSQGNCCTQMWLRLHNRSCKDHLNLIKVPESTCPRPNCPHFMIQQVDYTIKVMNFNLSCCTNTREHGPMTTAMKDSMEYQHWPQR